MKTKTLIILFALTIISFVICAMYNHNWDFMHFSDESIGALTAILVMIWIIGILLFTHIKE